MWPCSSLLLGAVRAVDVITTDDEALVGQGEAAPLAVEAVLVPGVALVVHHVGAMAEPCGDRGGRAMFPKDNRSNIQTVLRNPSCHLPISIDGS